MTLNLLGPAAHHGGEFVQSNPFSHKDRFNGHMGFSSFPPLDCATVKSELTRGELLHLEDYETILLECEYNYNTQRKLTSLNKQNLITFVIY